MPPCQQHAVLDAFLQHLIVPAGFVIWVQQHVRMQVHQARDQRLARQRDALGAGRHVDIGRGPGGLHLAVHDEDGPAGMRRAFAGPDPFRRQQDRGGPYGRRQRQARQQRSDGQRSPAKAVNRSVTKLLRHCDPSLLQVGKHHTKAGAAAINVWRADPDRTVNGRLSSTEMRRVAEWGHGIAVMRTGEYRQAAGVSLSGDTTAYTGADQSAAQLSIKRWGNRITATAGCSRRLPNGIDALARSMGEVIGEPNGNCIERINGLAQCTIDENCAGESAGEQFHPALAAMGYE